MSRLKLLCTDLDRTLLPNGTAPERSWARPRLFDRLTRDGVRLAYVTGRHRELVEQAMLGFDLPTPDHVVADVGASIFRVDEHGWFASEAWEEHLRREWPEGTDRRIDAAFAALEGLRPQAPERQGPFKRSFHAPLDARPQEWGHALDELGLRARIVHSIDEAEGKGLLDLLPPNAGKRNAIEFLRRECAVPPDGLLFAGDSGNDLDALEAPFPGVLVANASEAVRDEAKRRAEEAGTSGHLFFATGDDGHYAGGILQAIEHFWPEAKA